MSTDANSYGLRTTILFDFDGTIADCFEDIRAAVNHAMRGVGLPEHSLEAVRGMIGDGVQTLTRRACGDAGAAHQERVLELLSEHYYAYPASNGRLYDGMRELLEALREQGKRLAVVSNKPHEMMVRSVEQLEIGDLFDAVLGESPALAPKPSPAMILATLEMLDAVPSEALMVGDGPMDAAGAQAAGLPCIGVAWGMSEPEALTAAGVERMVESVQELGSLILADHILAR